MSLMIVSMLLMLGLSFAPFMYDDFYPMADATIIGYLVDTFSNGINTIVKNNEFLLLSNAFLISILFTVFVVFSIVYISQSVSALVRSIRTRTFFDLSKKVFILFSLFLSLFVLFVGFTLKQYDSSLETIGACPIIVIIIVPLVLSFNVFAQAYQKKNCSLFDILFYSISRLCIYVLLIVIIFLLGGFRFNVFCLNESNHTTANYVCGNVGFVSIIVSVIPNIYVDGSVYVIFSIILSFIAMIFETVILLFLLIMFAPIFSLTLNDYTTKKSFIVFSSLMVAFFIANIVLNTYASSLINILNDAQKYGVIFRTKVNNSSTVTALIISIVLLGAQIMYFAVSKRRKRTNDE
jgi:hypothetical protein